jgi:hypothetical protein
VLIVFLLLLFLLLPADHYGQHQCAGGVDHIWGARLQQEVVAWAVVLLPKTSTIVLAGFTVLLYVRQPCVGPCGCWAQQQQQHGLN